LNPVENAMRGIALGSRNWLFGGSDAGGDRAAAMYSILQTAKLNDVNPQAYLTETHLRTDALGLSAANNPNRRLITAKTGRFQVGSPSFHSERPRIAQPWSYSESDQTKTRALGPPFLTPAPQTGAGMRSI
jgi:hypothetical protein